jgi:hypothetical protein
MKKYIIAAFVALGVFASAAFAASLQVDAGTLQAGEDAISQCITDDVVVAYGDPEFEDGAWTIDQITLDHGGLCDELTYSVVITGTGDDFPTLPISATFDDDVETVVFPPFDAEGAAHVHLVIRTAS